MTGKKDTKKSLGRTFGEVFYAFFMVEEDTAIRGFITLSLTVVLGLVLGLGWGLFEADKLSIGESYLFFLSFTVIFCGVLLWGAVSKIPLIFFILSLTTLTNLAIAPDLTQPLSDILRPSIIFAGTWLLGYGAVWATKNGYIIDEDEVKKK